MAYGYRACEIETLDEVPDVKEDVVIHIKGLTRPYWRPPVMQALGCHLDGYAPVHVDPTDQNTIVAGVFKRVGRLTPPPDPELLKALAQFVRKWCEENLVPLEAEADLSFETWKEKTNYPLWRKEELTLIWDACNRELTKKEFFNVKAFVKDETYYPTFKHARNIFARRDEFKCASGPVFKAIEERVFEKTRWFIKKIPVDNRPAHIMKHLYREGAKYVATDYTAYESHFTKEILQHCEFIMYDYMTQFHPIHDEFMSWCNKVIAGTNHCEFKTFWLDIVATRMSGEMNTSLGNGFSNLMMMMFLSERKGNQHFDGMFEGDDGLCVMEGEIPTAEDFAQLGMTIKMEIHDNIETASFCGIVFDPVDMINVTDPACVLLNFGWSNSRYVNCSRVRRLELLRAKALSTAYTYPGCPIIQSLAQMGLRLTKHIDIKRFLEKNRSMSMWEREWLLAAIDHKKDPIPVPLGTRQLVERLYNIPISTQLELEEYFDSITSLTPLFHWCFDEIIPSDSVRYWQDYVRRAKMDGDFCYPTLNLNERKIFEEKHTQHYEFNYALEHGVYL